MNTTTRPQHLSTEEIHKICIKATGGETEDTKICMIQEELQQGIHAIKQYDRSVTMYGSAVLPETSPDYQKARNLAYRISKELGYAVMTGGGPGIMEAGNRGAYEADGKSIGLTIKLPREQHTNTYVTDEIPFYYFFSRKMTMSYTSEACIYFPGGFGTLDELFEILTLLQTKKIPKVPVILVGSAFWKPLDTFIRNTLLEAYETIDTTDANLYTILDDEDEILSVIKNAPAREDI